VCKPLDLNLQIGASFSNNAIVLDVKATGADQPVLYTWEVQDCTPAIATGARAAVTLVSRQPVVKAIRLCAFTAQGCMKVAFSQFNVG
jgi:diaminopimelate epimerase